MNRMMAWIVAVGLVVGLVSAMSIVPKNNFTIMPIVHAQDRGEGGCTDSTLNGSFGFHRQGTTGVTTSSQYPLAAVGIITLADGAVVGGHQTTSKNGVFTTSVIGGGTYHIDADCTGKLFFRNGTLAAQFSIVNRGREVFVLSMTPSNAVIEVWKRIEAPEPGE